MNKWVPIIIGIVLILLGIGWAAQGAGVMGGSSLMDNNQTFIYIGAILAIIGITFVFFGAVSKRKVRTAKSSETVESKEDKTNIG